ncbi:MAG: Asp-tRNA(Asn)/Glu-tRNA(Gln) amidotransferase subunit GatA [Oscillospiraceae bacterium]|jgi:aspartyl-tRNA(Asn)/glutamyl-tRNA(Gln) amidotransferase subunit A|nr:Asp-tRNA(Asn)/Glu-tRNA(Gln) amidotransferase subunit GatA [Oscillospiraceae bacterium]
MDVIKLTLKQLRAALDKRLIGAGELTREYLNRAKTLNPELNAFISVTEEEALANAETAQKIINSGESRALTGIPAAIKDNICTDGIKTTCGSKMLENFTPSRDAEVVKLLKEQGYALIGKTNLDEFAMGKSNETSAFGAVRNPIAPERVPGGSSGGSAAAVASSCCAFALGTDTGASIRQPASFCGITGLKPTYGRISRTGITEFSKSFDVVGPLAKRAEDCGVVVDALLGGSRGSCSAKIGKGVSGLTVATPKELFSDDVNGEIREAVLNAAKALEKNGVKLTEVSIPSLSYVVAAFLIISCAEAVSALSRFDGEEYGLRGSGGARDERIRDSRTRGFGDEVKRRLMLGGIMLSDGGVYFQKALAVKRRLIREFNGVFEKADAIVSPTFPRTAFKIGEKIDLMKNYSSSMYTAFANITGLPCVSVPCGKDKDGLPIGMSITGREFDEARILQIADFLERETGVWDCPPSAAETLLK